MRPTETEEKLQVDAWAANDRAEVYISKYIHTHHTYWRCHMPVRILTCTHEE